MTAFTNIHIPSLLHTHTLITQYEDVHSRVWCLCMTQRYRGNQLLRYEIYLVILTFKLHIFIVKRRRI